MFRFLRTQKRIEDLEETMERIDSAFKKLQVEWDDTYDKFRHLHMRVSKRMRDAEQRSEEHTSELQSLTNLVCRLLLEKKKKIQIVRSHRKTNLQPEPHTKEQTQ